MKLDGTEKKKITVKKVRISVNIKGEEKSRC